MIVGVTLEYISLLVKLNVFLGVHPQGNIWLTLREIIYFNVSIKIMQQLYIFLQHPVV